MANTLGGWKSEGEHPHRVPDDLYPTPPPATQALLRNVRFDGAIWECASGHGHISRELGGAGYTVVSTDLRAVEYGYGEVQDFLVLTRTLAPNIVTNPPYKLLKDFLRKAFELPGIDTVTFLIPLPTIPQVYVHKFFEEFGMPSLILALTPTLKIYMGEERGVQQSIFTHCWVHWNLREGKRTSSTFKLERWKTP